MKNQKRVHKKLAHRNLVIHQPTRRIPADPVGERFREIDADDLQKVARENGLLPDWKEWVDAAPNPGIPRMILGNVLRAKLHRGEPVKMLGAIIEASRRAGQHLHR